ncbi:hypothetical protein MKX01_034681 [Papaver californicum]|nr:hypothetical protein MKX01_034681 [Papaver californicum]
MENIRREVPQNDGSMILRFAHVDRFLTRQEIKDYFSLNFGGSSVKSIKLHRQASSYQALVVFAEVCFRSMSTVKSVLNGQTCVLLVMNGLRAMANAYARDPQTIDVVAAGSSPSAPATPEHNE